MLFTSPDFALFFFVVFCCYWFVFNRIVKLQNLFLLLSGYYFYACFDVRFLLLLVASTAFNFTMGRLLDDNKYVRRKLILTLGILVNAGILCYFKYLNFFIESFHGVLHSAGYNFSYTPIQLILPLGISFYTFQNISYLTDVYRGHTLSVKNYLTFSLYLGLFPQLISGPIERANHLIPQIESPRIFNYNLAVNGMRLILIGLFEKIVIADSCGRIVNEIYQDFTIHSASTLFWNAVLYSFQVYGDFSGYSHIAIGCSALLGFSIRDNFKYPYLAVNIADFWRRWHISFSTWLRDYVFFPLGGSKKGMLIQIRNLFIVFVLSGFWHGANATFIIYGFIHALFYILYVLWKKYLIALPSNFVFSFLTGAFTFTVLALARIFFRAQNVTEALHYLNKTFSPDVFYKPDISRGIIALLFAYLFIEWLQRDKQHVLDISFIKYRAIRYGIYCSLLFAILYFAGQGKTFLYFRF